MQNPYAYQTTADNVCAKHRRLELCCAVQVQPVSAILRFLKGEYACSGRLGQGRSKRRQLRW